MKKNFEMNMNQKNMEERKNMKKTVRNTMMAACVALSMAGAVPVQAEGETAKIPMRRMYNPNSGEHFYTGDVNEARSLIKAGWDYEHVGWYAPTSGDPVYRLYNPNAGDHHYTMDEGERDALIAYGWKYEGIGWYSDVNKEKVLFREYNPNSGRHNYTTDIYEHTWLIEEGWKDEGTTWAGVEHTFEDIPHEPNGLYYRNDSKTYYCYVLGELQTNVREYVFGSTYSFDANGNVIASAHKGVQAALEAVRIAEEGHGYSNENRWGPDYDCSSYVITCYKNVGVDTGNASWTGNMVEEMSKHGFEVIQGFAVDVPGDLYVTEGHVSMFVGWNYDPNDEAAPSIWLAEALPEDGVIFNCWDMAVDGTGVTLRYRG